MGLSAAGVPFAKTPSVQIVNLPFEIISQAAVAATTVGSPHVPFTRLIPSGQVHLTDEGKLSGALADGWERRLTPAFEQTRVLRNSAGHPTGAAVSNDDAHSGLLLFPGLYDFVDKVIQEIDALLPPAATPVA
jgi:hypothetical protein